MNSMQSRSSRQGFSLIEVAIALVIFVIGALAIIKIFPGALNVIGNNGDQQVAMNLNRDVAARLKTDGSVPTATFNTTAADSTFNWTTFDNTDHTADYVDYDGSVLGVPRFNYTLPTNEDINTQSGNSALSRFRGILGERGAVEQIGTDYYTTTQFPISIKEIGGNLSPLRPTISQEYIVRNARMDKDKHVDFANATTEVAGQETRLDSAAAMTMNNLPVGSMVYVSYRYFNNSKKIWSVQEEAIPVTAALMLTMPPTPLTVNPPTTTNGAILNYDINNPTTTGTVAESIDVRVKNFVGAAFFGPATAPAPGDSAYPNADQITSARCGLIRLPVTAQPITAGSVSIDYVADWSWLMQKANLSLTPDEARPPVTDYSYQQLALGAPFIEDQAPIGVYSLLRDPKAPKPIYASRFGTTNMTPDPDMTAAVKDSGLMTPTESELRSGKLTFAVANPSTSAPVDKEPRARVSYKTRDSWTQQLAVAASNYKPYVVNNREPWRDYYLGNDNYIYFHAGEAGKTVSISYLTTDGGGSTIVDRPFVIDQQIIDTPTANPANVPIGFTDSKKVSRVQLTNFSGGILATADLVSIQAVKGNSVTMRTAYINGSKYAQTLLTSNRGTN